MRIYNEEGNLINDVQEALYELGNVGTGMASATMGHLLNKRIYISTPKVVSISRDSSLLFGAQANDEAVGIVMNLKKTLAGVVLFIVDKEFIKDTVEILTGSVFKDCTEMLENEMGFSAIQEIGNVAGAAYVKAIGGYSGIRIYLSPVLVGMSEVKSLVFSPYMQEADQCDKVICIDSELALCEENGEQMKLVGHVIMMPYDKSVKIIMKSLGL